MSTDSVSYKQAGVDIDAGDALVERIKSAVKTTHRAGVMGAIGGFGGFFDLSRCGYRDPVLVASTDGVGTKLRLAIEMNRHDTIGIDLVAMCVNDVIVQGAEPLFFLDYFASGKLDVAQGEAIIRGIVRGCEQAGCALIGGETAEMPGMYAEGDYDLAGFCVGAVERDRVIDGSRIVPGDVVLGLPSSGVHSNGYSLVRKLLQLSPESTELLIDGRPVREVLLTPTRIYVRLILDLLPDFDLKGLAHVTGGGLTENVPRVLPENCRAEIDLGAWRKPNVFKWLEQAGRLSQQEMLRTFNCGIGMVLVAAAEQAGAISSALHERGEPCFRLGEIGARTSDGAQISFQGSL
jgi:phosphoribosylformylglycinamidine cyclo-ligase